jgi:hypothetical protein
MSEPNLFLAMFDTLQMLQAGPPHRYGVTEFDGFTVSTVRTLDHGPETAVCDKSGEWHPVERYGHDAEESSIIAGHESWVQRIKSGERSFTDLSQPNWGLDPEPFTLVD